MKFKVGDIVRGISGSPYRVTNEQMTKGVVTSTGDFGGGYDAVITVLEHETKPNDVGREFLVDSEHFKIYD